MSEKPIFENLENPEVEAEAEAEIEKEEPLNKEDNSLNSPELIEEDLLIVNNDALDKQSQGIDIEEKKRPENKKFLKGLRNTVGGLIVFGLSLTQLGCKGDEGPKLEPERQKIESLEKNEDKSEINKKLLREIFFDISNQGSFMGESRDGNLIVGIGGGNFYELTSNNLQELMDLVGEYNNYSSSRVQLVMKETLRMKVVDKIKQVGQKIDYIDLPENLRINEMDRRESVDQMQKGSIIQPY